MKKLIVLLLICISNLSFTQEDYANVYITRTGFTGSAIQIKYFLNDSFAGKISHGEHLHIKCPPGKHKLWVPATKNKASIVYFINLEKNETYYMQHNLGVAPFLSVVNNDQKKLNKVLKKINKQDSKKPSNNEVSEYNNKYASLVNRINKTNYSLGAHSDYKAINRLINKKKRKSTISSSYNPISSISVSSSSPNTNLNLLSISKSATSNVNTTENLDYSKLSKEELEAEKKKAVEAENYTLASIIKDHINAKKVTIEDLEKQKQQAIAEEDYSKAAKLKQEIISKKALENKAQKNNSDNNTNLTSLLSSNTNVVNKRETALANILANKPKIHTSTNSNSGIVENTYTKTKDGAKQTSVGTDNKATYRRSSLYTLMIDNPSRQHETTIKNTFGNTDIPEKFNDHNVGPYLIATASTEKDKTQIINNFLTTNNIAKQLVAKWFNRSENGGFNMDLISERGTYNATDLDVKLAQNTERGNAILADAGEELIKNTFVVVNDYKYTDKAEVAKKANKALGVLSFGARLAGLDVVADVADVATVGTAVAGKGYIIKSTTYLYKLVWNDETAATFYNEYWTTDDNLDPAKKEAFDNSNAFQLELVGNESAWADLQSSIFTQKADTDLISIATVKSTNKAIAKLQRKYEVFRTKTPLLSGDPITAKIGLKEGLEKGDKFEVLEQVLTEEGRTKYKRVGIIKVEKSKIWDNRYNAQEEGHESKYEYTTFKGPKNKFYPGMLIRQIN